VRVCVSERGSVRAGLFSIWLPLFCSQLQFIFV
jgi:hypothetical protein